MKYYEVFLSTKPPGTKKLDGGGWTNKYAYAIAVVVYHGKEWWHLLLTEEQWGKWKEAAAMTVAEATAAKKKEIRQIARDAKRVPQLAPVEKWSKLPHVFGPGRSPSLDNALDEDVYAKKDKTEIGELTNA